MFNASAQQSGRSRVVKDCGQGRQVPQSLSTTIRNPKNGK